MKPNADCIGDWYVLSLIGKMTRQPSISSDMILADAEISRVGAQMQPPRNQAALPIMPSDVVLLQNVA